MSAPIILQTSPADEDVGIPVGSVIEIIFDNGIDLSVAKEFACMYGPDNDLVKGPHGSRWINKETGENPFFLTSPGFKGFVALKASVSYVDTSTYADVDPGAVLNQAGEAGIGHKLTLVPESPLAPDTCFTLHLIGDPDGADSGICHRTVFDIDTSGVVSTTGTMYNYGGYTGTTSDTIVVEITTSGNIGTAVYRWYYQSAGVGTAISGRITRRTFHYLDDGVQIRFSGSGFLSGDKYVFAVEPPVRMTTSTKIDFCTNDGTYSAAPDSPSTPATSSPPDTLLPAAPGAANGETETRLLIEESTPSDADFNIKTTNRTIQIVFSDNLDASTITADTVSLVAVPVCNTSEERVLQKVLTVVDNVLTIEY